MKPSQLAVHAAGWLPLAFLAGAYANNRLTVNPIQAIEQRTGQFALIFLLLTLACTPLNTYFGLRQAIKARRPLGLFAFLYASLHLLTFLGLDYGFNFSLLPGAIFEKRFIVVGLLAFLILLPLAVTSFDYFKKALGKGWKRLHRLVYLAGVLVVVHYAWAVKGDVLALRGNVQLPILAGALLALLLLARVPAVKRLFIRRGHRVPQPNKLAEN